ncbi:hypothetical protein T484DRAFT_1777933 [Baffinella frigidus]|nr:hypothetical protein T484DRAFT_1777933 [Cryptophyta sp. CCMP2293]
MSGTLERAVNKVSTVKGSLSQAVDSAASRVTASVDTATVRVTGAMEPWTTRVTDVVDSATSKVSGAVDSATSRVSGVVDSASGALRRRTGAFDVICVRQKDGSFMTTDWLLVVGRDAQLGTAQDVEVAVWINGEEQPALVMHVGKVGLFFVGGDHFLFH